MKVLCPLLFCVFAALPSIVYAQAKTESTPGTQAEDWVYLDNGKLRLGIIRSSGGAIGFLAQSGSPRNLLNHFDRGRLVQQSYYGDSDGSLWDKRPWRYNPVQGGDYRGKSPRLLELRSNSTNLYSRSVPLHWATGAELPECVMEQWVTLKGSIVHARFQMTYSGTNTHSAHHQEIPAIFVDASLATLVTYSGAAPWTSAALTRRTPGADNEYLKITENWVAYVDAKDFGVGAYVPIATEVTCYRFLGGSGSDCSYVAPITTFALKPGLKFTYDAYFAIGSLEQLREQFSTVRKTLNAK
jgi:hypothetical protein